MRRHRLQWLFDTSITVAILGAGVASLVLAARTGSVLSWGALGLASSAFIAFLAVAFRIPAALRRIPGRHIVDIVDSRGVHLSEGQEGPDRRALRRLGGRRDFLAPWVWTFPAPDERALASVLGSLRDLGVVFLGIDKGWSPGDIFEDLRERGLVNGPFEEIVWSGPGMSEVRRR